MCRSNSAVCSNFKRSPSYQFHRNLEESSPKSVTTHTPTLKSKLKAQATEIKHQPKHHIDYFSQIYLFDKL